jgi:hypothetical protein
MKTKLLLLHLLVPLVVFSQITQIGQDIDGEESGDRSGWSVSSSDDGSIVAIGAPENEGNGNITGHVRIYQNNGGVWTQIGEDIDGTGMSIVSLSDDGSIVAIGSRWASGANGPGDGEVKIYQNLGGTWGQIGEDIEGHAVGEYTGEDVCLSADGSIVAIGSGSNHVRVYQNTGGVWTQVGQDIDGEGANDLFGEAVSLSDDGSIVAIGARWNDGNGTDSGHVRVFQNTGGNWVQIGEDIEGEATGDELGCSVSLNQDGSIVAIGARWNDGNGDKSGHARVYQNIGGTWTQIGQDMNGEAAGDDSGLPVSLSKDGGVLAIAGRWNDGNGSYAGHVRIYQNTGGNWVQLGEDIDGEAAGDRSGRDVSLNANGSVVAIGAYLNDGNGIDSGHVRVFDLSGVMGFEDNSVLDFSVYPSPTSGILKINSETTITQIEIYNLLGQLVKFNTNQNIIDISSVDQGVYFVKVMDENGYVGTQKVMKK